MAFPAPAFAPDIIRQITESVPHLMALGATVLRVEHRRTALRLNWREDLVGDPWSGVLHGGVITTLLDSASGMAALSAAGAVMQIATLDLRIDYLRPARTRQPVIAEAECYHMTRSIAFVRGRAHHEDGTEIATSTAAFMLQSSALPVGTKL